MILHSFPLVDLLHHEPSRALHRRTTRQRSWLATRVRSGKVKLADRAAFPRS